MGPAAGVRSWAWRWSPLVRFATVLAMGDGGPQDKANARDPYSTLGIAADAISDDVVRAYRRLAREHHPDVNPEADAHQFAGITDAYEVLRDPQRRRAYDGTRRARADAAAGAAAVRIPVRNAAADAGGDERPAASAAGRDQERRAVADIELPLSFEQAALGTTVDVHLDLDLPCEACAGTGSSAATCGDCGGAGSTSRASGAITIRHVCPSCAGTGRRRHPCDGCEGRGRRSVAGQAHLRVLAGVEDGALLRFRAPVANGPREMVAVVRTAPHPYFGRRGRDLTLRLPLTLAEAALGGVVTIPTLGDAVAIRIPAGTPHGRTFRVRGQGIPSAGGPGDLLVTVELVVPGEVNDAQRAALEAFATATESPRKHFES